MPSSDMLPEQNYTISIRVYEPGEDTFIELHRETLPEALQLASNLIGTYVLGVDPVLYDRSASNTMLDSWTIVDLTGGDPTCKFEVQWTETDNMAAISTDYILQVVSNA